MTLEKTLTATKLDDRIRFTLSMTNTGSETVSLTFRDAGKADFVVFAGAKERWRWSDGQMFAQMLTTEALEPGDALSLEATWDDPEPGEFEVVCELRTMDGGEERTTFSV